jgi:hypothetical protein
VTFLQKLSVCRLAKTANNQAGRDVADSSMDAQISKALMGVFMKATQVEAAVTDLILAANANCSTASSEEKQLSDLFEFLGITYDAGKAKTMGGTPCFNGPEGAC